MDFLSSKESEMKMGKKKAEKKFTFIDLFAGCGGFSGGVCRRNDTSPWRM